MSDDILRQNPADGRDWALWGVDPVTSEIRRVTVDPGTNAIRVLLAGSASGSTPGGTPTTAPSRFRLVSAATTNANLVKGAAGSLSSAVLVNTSAAAKAVKLYDKATAPVPGTDTPAETFLLPAGSTLLVEPAVPQPFTLGIGIAITGLPADSDITATAAGDVIVSLFYN